MEKELYGYMVDSRGFVWNQKHTAPLKGALDKDGYRTLCLTIDRKHKMTKEHRMVAEAFLDNPNGLPQVNHKNENKLDNRVENLEGCDCKYNINYGTANKRRSASLSTAKAYKYRVFKKDDFIGEFIGLKAVSKEIGIAVRNIQRGIHGETHSKDGYRIEVITEWH